MFKLNEKFGVDSLLYLLSHFECKGHTVGLLSQQCLPPPRTSTVKSSLFTHAHSRPFSLAARFHRCYANHSCYINNGWTFSIQITHTHTQYIYICTQMVLYKLSHNLFLTKYQERLLMSVHITWFLLVVAEYSIVWVLFKYAILWLKLFPTSIFSNS